MVLDGRLCHPHVLANQPIGLTWICLRLPMVLEVTHWLYLFYYCHIYFWQKKGQARLSLRIIHIESYSNVDTDNVESVHAHTTNLSFVTLSLLGLNETGMGKKQSKQQPSVRNWVLVCEENCGSVVSCVALQTYHCGGYCHLCTLSLVGSFLHMHWKCPGVASFWKIVPSPTKFMGCAIPSYSRLLILNDNLFTGSVCLQISHFICRPYSRKQKTKRWL